MPTEQIYFVPFTAGILMMAIPLTTYTISIHLGHIYPLLPYISDTGSYPPESCVFSQLANILAALIFVTVWVRHDQTCCVLNSRDNHLPPSTWLRTLNYVSFWTGVAGALGASIIANFQIVNQIPLHATGVLLGVGGLNVYLIQQTILSLRVPTDHAPHYVAPLRLVLTVINTVANTIFTAFFVMANMYFAPPDKLINWRPENPGFSSHLASTFAEWISDFAMGTFFLTMAQEFHCLSVASPVVWRRDTTGNTVTVGIPACLRTASDDSADALPEELMGLTGNGYTSRAEER